MVSKQEPAGMLATQRGKMKKTAVDRFNDNRQSETDRLSAKRKMEHDERMASIHLKRRKYKLRFGSTPTTTSRSSPGAAMFAESAEDKQIQILRLQIRLAELTQGGSGSALPSRIQYPQSPLHIDELSTPSSTYTAPSEAEVPGNGLHAAAPQSDDYPITATSDSCASFGAPGTGRADWDGAFIFRTT